MCDNERNTPHPTPPTNPPATHQQLPVQKLRKECGGNTESSPETVRDTSQHQDGGKTMLARHRFPSPVSFARCYRYFWPTLACQSRQMEPGRKKKEDFKHLSRPSTHRWKSIDVVRRTFSSACETPEVADLRERWEEFRAVTESLPDRKAGPVRSMHVN